MTEAIEEVFVEQKASPVVRTQRAAVASPRKQKSAPKTTLVLGLDDKQYRMKSKLSEFSIFEKSRRRAFSLLLQDSHRFSIVVAFAESLGGISRIENEVWATGFSGHLIIATNCRKVRQSPYEGRGKLVFVTDAPGTVAKILKK